LQQKSTPIVTSLRNPSRTLPKTAVASVVGLGGMFGSVAAMAFFQSAGLILERMGSYWSLFAIAAGAYVVALAIMHALVPRMAPARLGAGPVR
jgi:ACS family hexuronate transporter-like MFS transporter